MKFSDIFQAKQIKEVLFSSLSFTVVSTIIVIFFLSQYSSQHRTTKPPIKVQREFRAAWVATVANINWPSQPGLDTKIQQQEAIDILDALQANNFNVVIFQVRPHADALYSSELEPWSYYLTGEQGIAPEPYYDPLQFWIDEAHKRGLELHAWLNPYRAHHIKGGEVTKHSIVNTRPELVVKLEKGYYWLIPTKEETKKYSLDVVTDIIKRYDVDGIHFDDYFYPYPSYNNGNDFPDNQEYALYQQDGGNLSQNDWRREHVNSFIKRVYDGIKDEKNHVKFGLSPFGIWRPGYPESIAGMDQYEKLYADARLWLHQGWIDYFAPQLYWPINQYAQSFPILLNWWEEENLLNRHLFPGINTRQGEDEKAIDESINQIMISRAMLSKQPGNIFWNAAALTENLPFNEMLTTGPYKQQALVPASTWLDNQPPSPPDINILNLEDKLTISWEIETQDISQWVVYLQYGSKWQYRIHNAKTVSVDIARNIFETASNNNGEEIQLEHKITAIAVTSVDRAGNESDWNVHQVTKNK